MTPQEKDLIQTVFDRLSRSGVGQKDAEAEALIRDNFQRVPDAAYGLVQAVIVQEMGLNQATARLNELQRQLDEARAQAPVAGTGSFLGGASPWGGGSVPRSGAVAPQPAYAPASPPAAYATPPQGYGAPPPPASPWGQQPSAAGGFLRNAATMAAGVAGGTLIAEGLSSMFGGHHFGGGYGGGFGGGGLAGGSPWGGGSNETVENVTVNNYYGDRAGGSEVAGSDPVQDASYDSSDSGFDGGSFDDSSDV